MARQNSIHEALERLRAGGMVVLVDDESRENEGDVVIAAEFATPEAVNFMAKEARGLVCVAMTGRDLDRLGLPLMVPAATNASRFGSPFTVSVDARSGVTTGISAYDRARTIEVLINPESTAQDLSAPGHIFPLRAHENGIDGRRGHTEASVDLMRAASLNPAAVICEIMADDGSMARGEELVDFAHRHELPLVSIDQMDALPVKRPRDHDARPVDSAILPTKFGDFTVSAFRDAEGREHLALSLGRNGSVSGNALPDPLVRLHSECLTGDVLGSLRCDCGDQLRTSMARIAEEGRGIILYLRQEGRGIGLANKIMAYALQDRGLDTVEANTCLGFSPDLRDYAIGAKMLKSFGIESVRLMTNNPRKVADLEANDIEVSERVPLEVARRPENARYLDTKARKLDHALAQLAETSNTSSGV